MSIWQDCLKILKEDLSQQQYQMWIGPLKALETEEGITLLAPNQFVRDWVKQKFITNIKRTINTMNEGQDMPLFVHIDPKGQVTDLNKMLKPKPVSPVPEAAVEITNTQKKTENHRKIVDIATKGSTVVTSASQSVSRAVTKQSSGGYAPKESRLNPIFTFDNYVEGSSNQLPKAAAQQVVGNLGKAYNPFCICGPTGLGKTHLMHAVGHAILDKFPNARLVYLHAEQFVSDMVRALQDNTIDSFKRFYRSVDALLIDDIQFFAGKERSQEEFFHTFNSLLEAQQQVILTSDRYPKEIRGLEERLKSRFGSGLTVVVEPPELETRVAILIRKAEQCNVNLTHEVAFFIAKRIRSNVRELEGALKRVVANAQFTGQEISLDFVQNALKDLIALHDRSVSIDNILNTAAEYYNIKISDLKSKRRSRSVARPRQVAMTLAKELTNHSLPEIGEAFGGRDHTTVLHAIRTVKELRGSSIDMAEDYANLLRVLSA